MSRRKISLALSGLVLLFIAGAWLLRRGAFEREAAQEPAGSGYVSSATCAGCHQEIARTYRLTGMARSFSRPSAGNNVEDFKIHNTLYSRASDRYYTVLERDGNWFERRYQLGYEGKETNVVEKQIEYVIGSGNHSHTYLFRNSEAKLVEMPVSWYAEKGGYWAMSPGYDRAKQEDFRRTISSECFSCHNAYPQSAQPRAQVGASILPIPPLATMCRKESTASAATDLAVRTSRPPPPRRV